MHCVYEYFLLFTTSSAGQFPKCDDSTGGEWCGVFSKTLPNTSTAPQRKALFPNNIITRNFYNTIDIVGCKTYFLMSNSFNLGWHRREWQTLRHRKDKRVNGWGGNHPAGEIPTWRQRNTDLETKRDLEDVSWIGATTQQEWAGRQHARLRWRRDTQPPLPPSTCIAPTHPHSCGNPAWSYYWVERALDWGSHRRLCHYPKTRSAKPARGRQWCW